ncbi:hypothetical protein EI94DRAFT_1696036 [Lactarius quietus]|nr:hypothetical protein EI94DRAFT_1696036 [Lactarius quietus]
MTPGLGLGRGSNRRFATIDELSRPPKSGNPTYADRTDRLRCPANGSRAGDGSQAKKKKKEGGAYHIIPSSVQQLLAKVMTRPPGLLEPSSVPRRFGRCYESSTNSWRTLLRKTLRAAVSQITGSIKLVNHRPAVLPRREMDDPYSVCWSTVSTPQQCWRQHSSNKARREPFLRVSCCVHEVHNDRVGPNGCAARTPDLTTLTPKRFYDADIRARKKKVKKNNAKADCEASLGLTTQ